MFLFTITSNKMLSQKGTVAQNVYDPKKNLFYLELEFPLSFQG